MSSHWNYWYWPANQYEPIGEIRRQRYVAFRSFVGTIVISMITVLMIFTFWNLVIDANIRKIYYLDVTREASLLHTTSDKFLSFAIDTSLLRETRNFPLRDKRFLNYAKHLSPAYIRIGGTAADCLFFNETMPKSSAPISLEYNPHNITNFTINGEDFLSLKDFSEKAELRMIFDLNVLIRHPNNTWDSSNAKEIITFAKQHNFDLDWQMGNEPNSFKHVFQREISGSQLAEDYKSLRQILSENGYQNSMIFGPETNHIGDLSYSGVDYATEFLMNSDDDINYLTWHQYYLNGREATIKDFINVTIFNYLPGEIKNFNEVLKRTNKSLPTCISETSTAYGGGAPELSDRFVAGFLWLDKLGYSASAGIEIVIRQSFYGGNYAMIGPDLKPNPDWWISVAYKEFVSERVLKFKAIDLEPKVRLYAHCTPKKALLNRVPAVTVYGINLNKYDNVNIALGGRYDSMRRMFVYIFTADSLQSRNIRLNGKVLRLQPDGSLPPFNPIIYTMDEAITLPPLSMFFIVVHGTEITACTS